MTREEDANQKAAPRSPFNTGSMDITTAGATASLCGHPIPAEKTIVILRHGMTTWNEEQRIQVKLIEQQARHASKAFCAFFVAINPSYLLNLAAVCTGQL